MHNSISIGLAGILCALTLAPHATQAQARSPFDALRFREIGPAAMGGRMHDIQIWPGNHHGRVLAHLLPAPEWWQFLAHSAWRDGDALGRPADRKRLAQPQTPPRLSADSRVFPVQLTIDSASPVRPGMR